MVNGKTVSLKEILWKVLNSSRYEQLSYEDAAEYAIEAIRLIGAPLGYNDTVTVPPIKIENYKAALPLNLISIRGVKANGAALRYATDIYHKEVCQDCPEDNTYSVSNGIIFTSFKEGEVTISYKELIVDKDGYPLIPDNQKVKFAIEYYIRYRYLEPLWEMGKITDKVFERVNQMKNWYIGGSQSSMQLQNMDHFQAAVNSINRLIVNDNAYEDFFKGMGKKEKIKRYQ